MTNSVKRHLIFGNATVKSALSMLNSLGTDAILFAVDEDNKLIGSLTDGDVRRGLLKGMSIEDPVEDFIQTNPKHITKGSYSLDAVISYREKGFKIIPVLDEENKVVNVVNFRLVHSYLPIDAVIMAGGEGKRLRPLTENTPKPLLKIGDKPIMEHNIDRLVKYGVDDFWFSIKYLGEQIIDYFGDGTDKGVKISYITEDEPLGTIGAISKIKEFQHEHVLVTNSDLLTMLNYEDLYLDAIKNDADMTVVTIPYQVPIPYAVLETESNNIKSFKEKPTYTYYSNGGIYLIKQEMLKQIPANTHYNATDLMQALIDQGKKVCSYPLTSYWLDIGKHEDYKKAQNDIEHLNL